MPEDPRLRTPSLRLRTVLTVLVLLGAMLALLVVVTTTVLQGRLEQQVRDRLTDRAAFAAGLADEVDAEDLVRRLEGEDVSVLLVTVGGEDLSGGPLVAPPSRSADTPGDPPTRPRPGRAADDDAVQQEGDLLRIERDLPGVGTLVLGADLGIVEQTVAQVRLTLAVAAVVVLVVAAAVLWPLLGRALRPLQTITGLARSIGAGDRGRRLRPDRADTDLGRTAVAFDAMLDDVESSEARAVASEGRLRDFVADAAHELRTPVAGLRAAAEHVLRADPPREEREQTLAAIVRESGRVGRLVDDLLLVARIDRGLEVRLDEVDLRAIAEDVAARARHRHPDLRVEVAGPALHVTADADRLAQVVGNLVDNAARATGGSGRVGLELADDGRVVTLDVVDDGPGVPAEDAERVFERLVRLDTARSAGGFGLGLPIARGLARAHGGDLVLVPGGHGARFRLSLPRRGSAGARIQGWTTHSS